MGAVLYVRRLASMDTKLRRDILPPSGAPRRWMRVEPGTGKAKFLPTQAPQQSMPRLEPVKRLLLAVLERAVNDFHTYASVPTARGRRLFTEADAWFRSSTGGPFDFEAICQATELDPDFIRNGLRSSYGPGR